MFCGRYGYSSGVKIADVLIDGHPLRIGGGNFRICDGQIRSFYNDFLCGIYQNPIDFTLR